MRFAGASSKKLSNRVRPGVLLVRASPRRCVMALIALDLPELERPAKATSAPRSAGNCAGAAALIRKRASGKRLMSSTDKAAPACSVQFRALGSPELYWKQHHAAAPENRFVGNGCRRDAAGVCACACVAARSGGPQFAGRGSATHNSTAGGTARGLAISGITRRGRRGRRSTGIIPVEVPL